MIDAVLYCIEIYNTGMSLQEYERLCGVFRYYVERDDGVSCMLVYSTKDSAVSTIIPVRTGKRGRPRYHVVGKEKPPHVHAAIIGTPAKSAFSTCEAIKAALNKRYGYRAAKVVSKGRGAHARIFINYSLAQADFFRSYGNFDFFEAGMQDNT